MPFDRQVVADAKRAQVGNAPSEIAAGASRCPEPSLESTAQETGQTLRFEERVDAVYPDLDVLVLGHSHIPWDTTTQRGVRLLNPGWPTDRRRQP